MLPNFPVELYLWNMTTLEPNDTQIENYLLSWTIAATTRSRHVGTSANSRTFHYGGSRRRSTCRSICSRTRTGRNTDIETARSPDAIYSTNNKMELTYVVDKGQWLNFTT